MKETLFHLLVMAIFGTFFLFGFGCIIGYLYIALTN